jgi:hypothetical protein
MRIFSILSIIYLIIIILIIVSLNEIDKSGCECGKTNDKHLIKEWFIFYLIFRIITGLIIVISYRNNDLITITTVLNIASIVDLITIIMEIRLILYLNKMRKTCECAFKVKEQILFWFYLTYFLISLTFIFIFLIRIILKMI